MILDQARRIGVNVRIWIKRERKGRGIWNCSTEVRLRGGRRRRKGGREREKTEEEASMGNPPT